MHRACLARSRDDASRDDTLCPVRGCRAAMEAFKGGLAATTDADGSKLPEGEPEERLPEWCSEEFKAWWWRNCAG